VTHVNEFSNHRKKPFFSFLPGFSTSAASAGDRQEHGRKHQHDRDQCPRQLPHRFLGSLLGRHTLGRHLVLDGFHHDDRVVHNQTDRQDHAEQGQHVGGEPQRVNADIGPDNRERHRDHRDDRGAEALQEQEDH
jgi:hypothetical protein